MEKLRHNRLFFIMHDFINLWKFHVNIISLLKVIAYLKFQPFHTIFYFQTLLYVE